jgi:hypothetical protein
VSALARGYAEGLDDPVEVQRWCPSCREFVLAHEQTHACLWCEAATVPAAAAATTERRRPMAIAVRTCKIDGCHEEPSAMAGLYAGLCETHRDEARATRKPTGGGNGYVARVRALVPLARELDKTKRRLDVVGAPQQLQEELAEASRVATASPSPENLQRLEKAAKTLRRAAGRSGPATQAFEEAERRFKLALGSIANDFRGQRGAEHG